MEHVGDVESEVELRHEAVEMDYVMAGSERGEHDIDAIIDPGVIGSGEVWPLTDGVEEVLVGKSERECRRKDAEVPLEVANGDAVDLKSEVFCLVDSIGNGLTHVCNLGLRVVHFENRLLGVDDGHEETLVRGNGATANDISGAAVGGADRAEFSAKEPDGTRLADVAVAVIEQRMIGDRDGGGPLVPGSGPLAVAAASDDLICGDDVLGHGVEREQRDDEQYE